MRPDQIRQYALEVAETTLKRAAARFSGIEDDLNPDDERAVQDELRVIAEEVASRG